MTLGCVLVGHDARLDAAEVERMAQRGAFAISHRPDEGGGWLELLRDGLTFDLEGLAPGAAHASPDITNWYGMNAGAADLASITLSAGPHLAGAQHLLPVVRVAAALLADLAEAPGVRAIAWLPAGCASDPQWFAKAIHAWIAGGPFPALALSALHRAEDGAFHSKGLAFLMGHEFRLTGTSKLPCNEAARIAIRLTDWFVAHGVPAEPREITLEGVGAIWLAPQPHGPIEAHRR